MYFDFILSTTIWLALFVIVIFMSRPSSQLSECFLAHILPHDQAPMLNTSKPHLMKAPSDYRWLSHVSSVTLMIRLGDADPRGGTGHWIDSSWTSEQQAQHSYSGYWSPMRHEHSLLRSIVRVEIPADFCLEARLLHWAFPALELVMLQILEQCKHTTFVMMRPSRRFCWCSWGLSWGRSVFRGHRFVYSHTILNVRSYM